MVTVKIPRKENYEKSSNSVTRRSCTKQYWATERENEKRVISKGA